MNCQCMDGFVTVNDYDSSGHYAGQHKSPCPKCQSGKVLFQDILYCCNKTIIVTDLTRENIFCDTPADCDGEYKKNCRKVEVIIKEI